MSALAAVIPMTQPQPKCSQCIRDVSGKIAKPCARHRRKYNGNGAVSMSPDQLKAFLHAAQKDSPRDYALFLTMFLHGTRVSEVLNTRLCDVDFSANTVQVQALKGGKGGPEAMSAINGFDEREALLAYLKTRPETADTDPLFVSRKSTTKIQPMHRSYVAKTFVRLAKSIGLPQQFQHPHALRHTLGQLLHDQSVAENGAPNMPAIQFALRHQNPASTIVYAKPNANQVHDFKNSLLSKIL